MKTRPCIPVLPVSCLTAAAFVLLGILLPGRAAAQTNLTLNFPNPSTIAEDTVFSGTFSYAPPTMVVSGSVLVGGALIDTVEVDGTNVTITPVSNAFGIATILIEGSTPQTNLLQAFVLNITNINDAPMISAIGNVSVNEDNTTNRTFVIGDVDDSVGSLAVNAFSDKLTLIDVGVANITGTGSNRTLTLAPKPDQFGSATVTVAVSDGQLTNASSFVLTVNAVNDAPTNTPIGNVSVKEDQTTNRVFTIGDVDNTVGSLTVNAFSANPTLINVSAGNITGGGANKTLALAPNPNQNGTTTVTVTVSDGLLTNVNTFTLVVVSQPDRPTVTGAVTLLINDTVSSAAAFPGIGVGDVDHNMPEPETLTATIGINGDFGTFTGGTTNFVTSGSPSAVSAAIQGLQFEPAANFTPPGTTNFVNASISVADGTLTTNTTRRIGVVSVNDPPTLEAGLATNQMAEGASLQPFRVNAITDPDVDDSTFAFAIELVNTNQAVFGSFDTVPPATNGSFATIQDFALNLQYTAASGVMTSSLVNIAFRFSVTDGYGASSVVTSSLTIFQSRTAPSIIGVPVQTVNITDDAVGFIPFPGVSVTDPDEGGNQLLRATLTSSAPALGNFSQSGFTNLTPAQLTDALRLVEYIPVNGLLPVNISSNTVLTITVIDSSSLTNRNNNLTLSIKSVNSAPVISGIPSTNSQPVLLPTADNLYPFANLGLSNDDTNPITLSITIDNPAKGVLTNLGGFAETVAGTYQMSGAVAPVLASLTNLRYALDSAFLFPPDDPGGTVFTLTATDFALLASIETLYIQVQEEPRNHLVTRAVNDGLPGSFTYALEQAGNNDVITFALPSYPAVVRMPGADPFTTIRNLTIQGPGADLLTISGDGNGDDIPDRQIFRIRSRVTIEGVTLARGTAAYGGAVSVQSNGVLTLRRCAVVDSTATFYGGGIDVDAGQLILEGCFIGNNSVSDDQGVSGGGISIFSDRDCTFVNTTFSANRQDSESGDGGGALVAEDRTAGAPLNVFLSHCTFADNVDAANEASAMLSVGFGTRIRPLNSIFADVSERNMEVAGGGEVVSLGGNICVDSTRTTLTQGGQPEDVFLLDALTDATETDPLLAPLDGDGDPTPFYPLLAGSPAIDKAAGSLVSLDQRGVIRGSTADTGAIEYNALRRLVINEIDFDDTTLDFIEIQVRRDSAPIDLGPYALFVDDVKVHEFANSQIIGTNSSFSVTNSVDTLLNPGFGIVVAFSDVPVSVTSSNNPTQVVRPSVTNINLGERSVITIGVGGSQTPVARSSYLGTYLDPADGTNVLNITGNSISLAPQFRGFALVPHGLILPGPFAGIDPTLNPALNPNSIGADALGTAFGLDNAEPFALPDIFNVTEDDLSLLDVLVNDFDGDGNDRLVVVDVSSTSNPGTGDVAVTSSALGAEVSVTPAGSPLRGEAIVYDPRDELALQQLPVGVEISDTFYYEVIDIGAGPVEGYPGGTSTNTLVSATNHRLTSNDVVTISGCSRPGYNGTFPVTVIGENTFSIPVNYVGTAATNGAWVTSAVRAPTTRSEASVTIKVAGVNDTPVATDDVVTNVSEASVVRIMVRPELAGATNLAFGTDPVPAPTMVTASLQDNDTDIDTDDTWETLRVVGVLASVNAITGYSGTAGAATVTVHAVAHGLSNGDEVLIAGYGGHPSYNGYHEVTVVDADTFTIPVFFVDDAATKGVWVILNDANRYDAVTDVGATVRLTLRANPEEDHIIYDASASAFLNGLAEDELYTNRFYYAVEDSNGGIGIGPVDVIVYGLNDTPTATPDPDALGVLDPLVTGSNRLEDVLSGGLNVMYVLPPAAGGSNRVDLHVLDKSSTLPGTIVISGIWYTDEDTAIPIDTQDLVANDGDLDRIDTLFVESIDASSREGAALGLAAGIIAYNPAVSSNLQALARGELMVDTFYVVVSDGMTAGQVTSLVAVTVVGLNDTPVARPDLTGTSEDDPFTFNPLVHPTNNPALHDLEIDINGTMPDDFLTMVRVSNLFTLAGAVVDIDRLSLDYDPTVSQLLNELADWQVYTDRFEYTATDNSFLFANNDVFHVPAGSADNELDPLANDRDETEGGGMFTIIEVGPSLQGGVVTIATNGLSVVYDTPGVFVGDDHFYYEIENDQGARRRGLITVRCTVPQLNGVLSAADDYYTVAAGETVVMNVVANDNILPFSGAALTVSSNLISTSLSGQPVLVGNSFVYTATNGLVPLTFTYRVSAGGTAYADADVVVNVIERRGTLDVSDDTYSVAPGSLDNELDVLFNDGIWTSPTGGLRILEILDVASLGSVTTNATATALLYSADPDAIGIETIRYVATDTVGGTGTGLVSIIVGKLDAASDSFTIAATTNPVPVYLDVLANDRVMPNPEGTLTVVAVAPTNAAIGMLGVHGGTGLVFTADAGAVAGQVDFQYVATDASAPGRAVTGRVTVATVPAGAYANPDRYIVRGDGTDYELDVLANDISFPNVNKTYSIVSIGAGADAPNAGGTVSIAGGKLLYTPAPGYFGEESFTYLMSDSVATDSARVTISVRRGDLHANADRYSVYYELAPGTNIAVTFTLPVTLNDRILPAFGQVVSITGVGVDTSNSSNAPSQQGVVGITPDGLSLTYRPVTPATSNYIERFTYEISDGTDRRAAGRVEVYVANRVSNLVAITQDDAFTVERNSSNNTLSVLANDGVLPGSAAGWTVTGVSASIHTATVSIVGNTVRYSPPAGFVGEDAFNYSTSDGLGGTGQATVRIRVGTMPVLPDLFAVISGTTDNEFDVLANDVYDPAYAGAYRLHGVFDISGGGAASVSPGNTILYTPEVAYAGAYPYVETFRYRVMDDTSLIATGLVAVTVHELGSDRSTTTITVVVEGRNDQPMITNLSPAVAITDKEWAKPFPLALIIEVDEQTLEKIDVSVALDDAAKGTLRNLGGFVMTAPGVYSITNITAAEATARVRELIFEPTENRITVPQDEDTVFTITVTDNKSAPVSDTNSLVNVTAVNDAPVISGTIAGQQMHQGLPIKPFPSVLITEVDDLTLQPLAVTVTIEQPGHGTLHDIGIFAEQGGGVYLATGITAAAATDALRMMQFVVTSNGVTDGELLLTQFEIAVDDGFASVVTDDTTTVIAGSGLQQSLLPVAADTNLVEGIGWAIAMNEDTVVLGAPYAEENTTNVLNYGQVVLYNRVGAGTNAWVQDGLIPAVNIIPQGYFGSAVDIDQDIIVIGAEGDQAPAGNRGGMAYVYKWKTTNSTWDLVANLASPVSNGLARFGASVAVRGDTIAVGAPETPQPGTVPGGVFIYGRNQGGTNAWGLVKSIIPGAGLNNSLFGCDVALQGDILVAGASSASTIPTNSGAVFVYARDRDGTNQWGLVQRLTSTVAVVNARLGTSVDIHGDFIVAGAPREEGGRGAAYVFQKLAGTNLWAQSQRVVAGERVTNDLFGASLAIQGDLFLVGAPRIRSAITTTSVRVGAVYMFSLEEGSTNGWNYLSRLTPPSHSVFALYGSALDVHGRSAAVGAPIDKTKNFADVFGEAGTVYMYDFDANHAPAPSVAIPDQYAEIGQPFVYAIPTPAFTEPDFNDSFTVAVVFPSGSAGLVYDAGSGSITGVPSALGIFPVDVVATDEQGAASTNRFSIIVLDAGLLPVSTRTLWLLEYFGSAAVTSANHQALWQSDDDNDDSDADQEYVFGTDPGVQDATGLTYDIDVVLGRGTITFPRRTDDAALTYILEGADNILTGPWVRVDSAIITESVLSLSASFELVTLDVTMPPMDPWQIYRIRVTY